MLIINQQKHSKKTKKNRRKRKTNFMFRKNRVSNHTLFFIFLYFHCFFILFQNDNEKNRFCFFLNSNSLFLFFFGLTDFAVFRSALKKE